MQPLWLCLLPGKQFEKTFENTQLRKFEKMQSLAGNLRKHLAKHKTNFKFKFANIGLNQNWEAIRFVKSQKTIKLPPHFIVQFQIKVLWWIMFLIFKICKYTGRSQRHENNGQMIVFQHIGFPCHKECPHKKKNKTAPDQFVIW